MPWHDFFEHWLLRVCEVASTKATRRLGRWTARRRRATWQRRTWGEQLEAKQLLTRLVDVDTDGDQDVYQGANWYENTDGKGNLRAHSFMNGTPVDTRAADLDGDGDLDFVTSEPKWYENLDGRGRSFAPHSFTPGNREATRVRVQDVGNDGDVDVILFHNTEATWYENRGPGQEFAFHAVAVDASQYEVMDAADIDRDGDIDVTLTATTLVDGKKLKSRLLGVQDAQGNYATQLLQQDTLEYPDPFLGGVSGRTSLLDLDGDGLLDVVTRHHFEGTSYQWRRNNPASPGQLLAPQIMFSSGQFDDVVRLTSLPGQDEDGFIDWDHDGDLDAAGTPQYFSQGVLLANSAGIFSRSQTLYFDIPTDVSRTFVAVGDLNGDGAIDWVSTQMLDGVPQWYDGRTGAVHQNRLPTGLMPGDANRDLQVDEADLIAIAKAGRWQNTASWAAGDWNGAPGGSVENPPVGDGRFDQLDLQALRSSNLYRTGPYANTLTARETEWEAPGLSLDANEMVVNYDAITGHVSVSSSFQLSALQLHSMSGQFTAAPGPFSGPFDVATAGDRFRFDLNGFGVFDLGTLLPANLTWQEVQSDLKIDGARAAGGELGNVRLACTGCTLNVEELRTTIAEGKHTRQSDLNDDGLTDVNDLAYLMTDLLRSSIGDANLDGQFSSSDFVRVFQQGKYESTTAAPATWNDGDWNGDSKFNSGDLVVAFQLGRYEDSLPLGQATPGPSEFVVKPMSSDCGCFPDLDADGIKDLDGDGDLDVILSDYDKGRVFWQENLDGLGTFSGPRTIASFGKGPYKGIAADVDGDGDQDVLVGSPKSGYGNGLIHWYENVGGRDVFQSEPHVVNSPAGAYRLAMGDLDRDGDLDLVVGQAFWDTTGAVIWFANDGKGNFTNPTTVESGPGNRALSVIDLDGDGDLDIFSAYFSSARWFANDGTGKFVKQPSINVSMSRTYRLGDMNGDGKVDILAAGFGEASWFEYRNGSYVKTVLQRSESLEGGGLADIDQDGDLDVTIGAFPNSHWLKNNGRGVFDDPQPMPNVGGFSYVFFADFDGDADPDIVDGFSWYENVGGRFQLGQTLSRFAGSSKLNVVDFDGDQDLDVVGAIWFKKPSGPGSYESISLDPSYSQYTYDLDQDGDLDWIASYQSNLYWRENENGEGFLGELRWIREAPANDFRDYVQQLVFDDIDSDGDTDIIAALESRLVWFEQTNGSGRFELNREQVIDGDGSNHLALADMDGDGRRDLITTSGWLPRLAAGGFGANRFYPGSSDIRYVTASDLDLDGDLDLLAVDGSESYWIENIGGGVLQRRSRLRPYSNSLHAGDLDRDGDVDIVYADQNGELGWLERVSGGATPNYQAHALYREERAYWAIEIADADSDGDLDVVASTSSRLFVIENQRLR